MLNNIDTDKDVDLDNSKPINYAHEQLKDYLREAAEWRFNELTGGVEHKNEYTHYKWRPVEDYEINTMKHRLLIETFQKHSTVAIQQMVKSEFSPKVDPILSYFQDLKPYDPDTEPDFIQLVADCIRCEHTHKDNFWKKWIVAVVANVFNRNDCDNHICLCLRGKQGIRKTSFFKAIVPPDLEDYASISVIDTRMSNKELPQLLVCNVLAVFDDCLSRNLRNNPEETKALITQPNCRYRMPYAKAPTTWPRNASFGATINGDDFLTDDENRRFLVFDCSWIDHKALKNIDMDSMYRQAKHVFESGKFQYWFDEDEQAIIEAENSKYMRLTEEESMIDKYFEIPTGDDHKEKANSYLPPAEVLSIIRQKERSFSITVDKIGRALAKMGARKWQRTIGTRRVWVYSLKLKEDDEIEGQYVATNPEAEKAHAAKKSAAQIERDKLVLQERANRVFDTIKNEEFDLK